MIKTLMIGPHEDQELDLMLQGKKPCAMFHDVISSDGSIPESIIPDGAFKPYVQSGKIIRFEYTHLYQEKKIKRVIFTLPDEQWRADALLWLVNLRYTGRKVPNNADDIFIGMLLGYDIKDVQDFIESLFLL